MCHCGYEKFGDDDGCCDCCNSCCNCVGKTCCCCCHCGLCCIKFLCWIICIVGVLLVLYVIMMAVTDSYLASVMWRDQPFHYKPECEKPYYDLKDEPAPVITCDSETGHCEGYTYLYMYGFGGSGFLGATYYELKNTGVQIRAGNGDPIDIELKLYDTYHISESRENKIPFKFEFDVNKEDADLYSSEAVTIDFDNFKITSIDAAFWDFMPIGPGDTFGVADGNKFYNCEKSIYEDDPSQYMCDPGCARDD